MRTDQKLFCLKLLLTIFLSILWLVGAAVFGVLLWLRLDYWTNEYLKADDSGKLENYLVLIYIILATGGIIVLFSLFGLIGGCLKKKWLIVLYLVSICISICLTIGGVVYGIIYSTHDLDSVLVKGNLLQKIIQKNYNDELTNPVRRSIDIMQSELECCGGASPDDYRTSTWFLTQPTQSSASANDVFPLPATCCKRFLVHHDRTQTCPRRMWSPQKQTFEKNSDVWEAGCQKELRDFLTNYYIVVIVIAGICFVLMIVCLIICSVYISLLNSLYVPQPDDIVYDMAHNQEKSPYPSRGDYREYYH